MDTPASWLFVLGDESIWVIRVQRYLLVVHGPGSLQQHHTFSTDAAVDEFQVLMAERLFEDGWVLWGTDLDRRRGGERRRVARDTPDRRMHAAPLTVTND